MLEAARLLLERRLSYVDCIRAHHAEISRRYGASEAAGERFLTDWPDVLDTGYDWNAYYEA